MASDQSVPKGTTQMVVTVIGRLAATRGVSVFLLLLLASPILIGLTVRQAYVRTNLPDLGIDVILEPLALERNPSVADARLTKFLGLQSAVIPIDMTVGPSFLAEDGVVGDAPFHLHLSPQDIEPRDDTALFQIDGLVVERLAGVLRAERDDSGVSILLIEQNVKFALSVADRYAVLKMGEIVDRGEVAAAGVESRITDQLSV